MTIEQGDIEVVASEAPVETQQETAVVENDEKGEEAAPVETKAKSDFAAKLAASKAKDGEKTVVAKAEAKPSYTPNFKFKVLDKELEFEDWAKGLVKDGDTEKKVREFHEKAYGLESVKADRATLKAQLGEAATKLTEYETGINNLHAAKAKKDYDSFFEAWDIPKEDIIKYALEVVKREEDPNAKAQWENSRRAIQEQSAFETEQLCFDENAVVLFQSAFETEQQRFHQSRVEFAVEKRLFELDYELSKPDNSVFIQAYEQGSGKPGSFKEFVQQIGASVFATSKRDIPASEAVQIAIGHLRAANPMLGMKQEPTVETAQKVVSASNKPVIPNIRGSGGSPVRQAPKSIADLKARAKELEVMAAQ